LELEGANEEGEEGEGDALRTARVPPVKKPEMMALYGSSFCR